MEWVRHTEGMDRGWYAGPIGWVEPEGGGYFGIAIRSGLLDAKEAYLYAGAGIVNGSEPEKEWRETQLKLRPMLQALTGGTGEL